MVVGMGTALLAVASSADLGQGQTGQNVAAAQSLEEVRDELASAITVERRSEFEIAFTIADRTGDGLPENVVYRWEGKAGSPLMRAINGNDERPVVPSVDKLAFQYLIQPEAIPTLTPTGALASFAGNVSISAPRDAFQPGYQVAQGWFPGAAAGASRGVISRIIFSMRREAAVFGPSARVRVFTGDGATPTSGTLLGTAALGAAAVPITKTYTDTEFVFSPPIEFTPSRGVWIVLDAPGCLGDDYFVALDTQTRALNVRGYRAVSGDSGASWTRFPSTSCSFRVIGSWKTTVFPQEAVR